MTLTSPQVTTDLWIAYTMQTRRFGSCYVHSAARRNGNHSWSAHCVTLADGRGVTFSWSGYGRSLQAGGHKFKVHARFSATGLPVPSKLLRDI